MTVRRALLAALSAAVFGLAAFGLYTAALELELRHQERDMRGMFDETDEAGA